MPLNPILIIKAPILSRLARRTTSHRRSCQASTMRLDTLIPKTLNPETLKP